jgi:hypothetical protein
MWCRCDIKLSEYPLVICYRHHSTVIARFSGDWFSAGNWKNNTIPWKYCKIIFVYWHPKIESQAVRQPTSLKHHDHHFIFVYCLWTYTIVSWFYIVVVKHELFDTLLLNQVQATMFDLVVSHIIWKIATQWLAVIAKKFGQPIQRYKTIDNIVRILKKW